MDVSKNVLYGLQLSGKDIVIEDSVYLQLLQGARCSLEQTNLNPSSVINKQLQGINN